MARQIPEDELKAIIETLAKHGRPASIAEIAALLSMNMPRRTLQRRVAVLVGQGRLQQEGRGRASRYRLPENKGEYAEAIGWNAVTRQEAEQRLTLRAGRSVR